MPREFLGKMNYGQILKQSSKFHLRVEGAQFPGDYILYCGA
jgi:hypothetical protein